MFCFGWFILVHILVIMVCFLHLGWLRPWLAIMYLVFGFCFLHLGWLWPLPCSWLSPPGWWLQELPITTWAIFWWGGWYWFYIDTDDNDNDLPCRCCQPQPLGQTQRSQLSSCRRRQSCPQQNPCGVLSWPWWWWSCLPVQDGALIIDVLDLHTILCLQRGKKSECRIFKHR